LFITEITGLLTEALVTANELTIRHAQVHQPWAVPYSDGVMKALIEGVPHILGSHVVLHAAKSVGKIATVFEKFDHGERRTQIHTDAIAEMAADLVTAALRLANLYGFDLASTLVDRVEEKNGVNILKT
jgi:hypothetical protein